MNTLGKRGRGLDPAVMAWLASTLKLGPGIGDVHVVVKEGSAHESWVRDNLLVPPSHLHFDIVAGEDALTADRNDVLLVYPGKYTGTGAAPHTWSKDQTHLVGMSTPQKHEYAGRGVIVRTLSTDGVFAMKNTGDLCQFHNVAFQQWGQAAACLTAFREEGHMNLYKGCHMFGQIRSDTVGLTTSSSLEVNSAVVRAGSADVFVDCVIGGSGGAKRTAANGTLRFATGGTIGAGCDMQFRDCQFMSWMEDVDPCAVLMNGNYSVDRLLLFEGCTFYNFVENHGATIPAYVFRDGCATTHDVILKRCSRLGFTAWTNTQTFVFSSDAKGETDGGEAIACDVS